MPENTARLTIRCCDQPGIVAAVTGFLFSHGANILHLDQHSTAQEGGDFFMRVEFSTPHLNLGIQALEQAFISTVAERYKMDWSIHHVAEKRRIAIFVSKHDHALLELLWRHAQGELDCEIAVVISNHDELRAEVERFGLTYHHVPASAATRAEAEQKVLELLPDDIDLIVLARYMQILSADFVARFSQRIINIHHSFLPAFAGADPYQQAFEKGVKLIGATAHYVTAELDEGPIIEQDIARVSHRENRDALKRMGRDLERQVLSRAVDWHLEDRVIVDGSKTIVFR